MSRREWRNLWLCSLVQTVASLLLYLTVTGWTGTPGLKPPVPNLARPVALVVVPSANTNTWGQASGESDLSVISCEACWRLSWLFLLGK